MTPMGSLGCFYIKASTFVILLRTGRVKIHSGVSFMYISSSFNKNCPNAFSLNFSFMKEKKTFLKTKTNLACIMNDSKMCILVAASRFGLLKGWRFSQMICNEFFFKSLVIGFWKQGLLFQDRQNSHGFLKHVNTFLQIHTKIHHSPFDTFKFEINDYKFIVFKQCSILTPDYVQIDPCWF